MWRRPHLSLQRRRAFSSHATPRVVNTIAEYRDVRNAWFREGRSVGFVPTMGALHSGHLSLAKRARSECDIVVSSIFVNPAQFAPTEDLARYPRTFKEDLELLSQESVDVVFSPSVEEMYPRGITLDVSQQVGTFVEVKGQSHQMEGVIRPHFFRGVATVVTKLFNIIQPTSAYFGQKDGQQCAVVRSLVRDLCMPLDLVVCDTVREKDGLAMSSRNRYLSASERASAPILYKGLQAARVAFENGEMSARRLEQIAVEVIANDRAVSIEYITVANLLTMDKEETVGADGAMMCGALRLGKTRIIDNIILK